MANFEDAFKVVARNEGLYDNDPDDPGGETCWGLIRRDESDWEGWSIIDDIKKTAHNPNNANEVRGLLSPLKEKLKALAAPYFKKKYWDKIAGDQILSQALAVKFVDTSYVNGVETAIMMQEENVGLPKTGKVSPELLNRLNATL